MYLQFYDLHRAPFQNSIDPDFFWQGKKIHKLLKILTFDFERHTRISIITGDPGCGKTSVFRAVLDSLNPSVLVSVVQDSRLSVREFYDLTGNALGLPDPLPTRKAFHKQILALLHQAAEQEKHVLLVLDEAQQLSPQLIDEIDAIITLGNQELEGLSVCLIGQLDNADCLKGHILSFFENHDMVLHHIAPMTEEETGSYIQHRLQVAGTTRKIFTDDAVREIHKHSGGYPVQINNICDLALFIGQSKQATKIDDVLILATADKLQFSTRQGDVPTNHQIDDAGRDKDNNADLDIFKPDKKQRISALEDFAQMDQDKEKQEPEPNLPFALPALWICLLLLLGTSGYMYYHNKQTESPEVTPQVTQVQFQEKEQKAAISQIPADNFTPAREPQDISPKILTPTLVDNTLSMALEKTPDKRAAKPNYVSLQEKQPVHTPVPLKVQLDDEKPGEDKLVMPQLQEQIQDLLPETTSDIFQEQAPSDREKKNQKKVALLLPEKSLPKPEHEKPLPALKRSQQLNQFLAGGSFAGEKKSEQNRQPVQNKEKGVSLSSTTNKKKQPHDEPAPTNVIDWLLKKKTKGSTALASDEQT